MAINWATDPVPARTLPYIPMERMKAGGFLKCVITCNQPIACHCHFVGGRTLPCVQEQCPGCILERRKIRECYLTVIGLGKREHVITVLTPGAERNLYDLAPEPIAWRGLVIEIKRRGSKANGKLAVNVADERIDPSRLPPAPDLMAHLYQVWGLTSELFGSDHPLWDARATLDAVLRNGHGTRNSSVDPNMART